MHSLCAFESLIQKNDETAGPIFYIFPTAVNIT